MGIKIIDKSKEFNAVETYLLTTSQDITLVKDIEDGTEIDVIEYLVYAIDRDNSETIILSVITPDNKVYSTVSATFRDAFMDIWSIMSDEIGIVPIIKKSGVTKKERTFLTCVLNTAKLMK